ncbi:sporulation protein [Fredinandcohnia sp. SECRCQ15]|uniref:Sporulation protein n=2 Tax=Fredinandcohnia quinoae TaxID=2918902 RepID=A0AAW5ECU0_9BACI|nr:sporulation protein [Fredinandcohnia sp. SECRCQ15]
MRIPPLYEKPGWQRFFAGVAVGALISWFVFLYQFGVLQEEQLLLITKQQGDIKILEEYRDTLLSDKEKLNEENKKKLKIQEFKIDIIKNKKNNLDSFITHSLRTAVKEDLNHLIGEDVESISNTKELLIKAIENKTYEIDEKKYKLQVYVIVMGTTLEITLKIELVK